MHLHGNEFAAIKQGRFAIARARRPRARVHAHAHAPPPMEIQRNVTFISSRVNSLAKSRVPRPADRNRHNCIYNGEILG